MSAEIEVTKVGGIWHGYLKGDPSVDERGLTEEIARRKVQELLVRRMEQSDRPVDRIAIGIRDGLRIRAERKKANRR